MKISGASTIAPASDDDDGREAAPCAGGRDTPASDDARAAALRDADRRVLWHPFTQATEWLSYDPLVIDSAEGFWLIDAAGRRYLDGVSSLWCNVHGHGHPAIVEALHRQIDKLQHSTMLGLTHAPAIELAERLVAITPAPLTRVFYSDSGSTSVEVALRMAFQYQRQRGRPERTRFVTLSEAYHGDTIGSVSLGFSEPFHRGYEPITFRVSKFDPPFLCAPIEGRGACDRTSLETASRESLARLARLLECEGDTVAAVVMEPLVQGAAGIWPQPPSFVRGVRELCDRHGCLLVCDEVATGFGRTGTMFAIEHAGVCPDILCLAKGITGGYLPLAATLATEEVYDAFSGMPSEYRALFHGHTYGGNPLGCAAAIASLDVFESERTVSKASHQAALLAALLDEHVSPLEHAGPVRRVGTMVGFDLWRDAGSGVRFATDERRAHRAVLIAREHGVIVRPLGDTMVLMPPLSLPDDLVRVLVETVARAVDVATRD
jgi:adenosylmethionine---8-amino-7-oxononanoate aminotransferase